MWTSLIRTNYFLYISFNPIIPRKHTGVFFWISETQVHIHWFICGFLPGKCFKSTWLSMWRVGGILRNPVEKKSHNISKGTRLWKCVYSTERSKRTTQPSPLLCINTQGWISQLNPVCVSQCDKLSLTIIPFLCQKLPYPICV